MDDSALVFGNYRACEALAVGGFGQVYRGEHRYLSERVVAIKVMRDAPLQTEEERAKFLQEANLLERLKEHRSILPVLDVGIQENVPYLVTEYAPGGSLRQRLRRGQTLPINEALAILAPVANALHFAHEHRVIHRDLKPENILFNVRGEPLLADFGIATLLGTASYHQTKVTGTPAYMAPEQFRGQVCAESDQYACACLAYELFTGYPPFVSAGQSLDFVAFMYHHIQEQPQSPLQFNPDLPAHISSAILKALTKDRTQRYPTMLAFLAALQATLQGAILTQTFQAAPPQESRNIAPTQAAQGVGTSIPAQIERGTRHFVPTQAAQLSSKNLLTRAQELCDQDRYEEALAVFDQALQVNPVSIDAYTDKSAALSILGRYEEALDALERALQIDPTNAVAYNNKGYILGDLGRYEEALDTLERAIRLNPRNAVAYHNKVDALINLGRYEEALGACELAIQLDPTNVVAYHNKGAALNNLGRYNEALKACERAIRLNPTDTVAYNNMGRVLNNLDRYADALKAYERAIQIDPTNADAYHNKGNILRELGHQREANEAYNRARALGWNE